MKRLLDVLREDCGLTGTKEGCGEGECGACTVLIDGAAGQLVPGARSRRSRGAQVTTIEGLGGRATRSSSASSSEGGAQCGICTPGMILAAAALPRGASRDDVRTASPATSAAAPATPRSIARWKGAGLRPAHGLGSDERHPPGNRLRRPLHRDRARRAAVLDDRSGDPHARPLAAAGSGPSPRSGGSGCRPLLPPRLRGARPGTPAPWIRRGDWWSRVSIAMSATQCTSALSLCSPERGLSGSRNVLLYAGFFWIATHLFVLAYEEPHLESTFGAAYEEYRSAVPRWLPRLRPWTPPETS